MPRADVRIFEMTVGGERLVVVSTPAAPKNDPLSATEREVAAAAARGLTNAAIARLRGRSERTVANQLAAVYRKLGLSSRVELASRGEHRRG